MKKRFAGATALLIALGYSITLKAQVPGSPKPIPGFTEKTSAQQL